MEKTDKQKTTKPKVARKAAASKPATAKPVRAARKKATTEPSAEATPEVVTQAVATLSSKPELAADRYVFATGRRKTAVVNVRLFSGTGKSLINKKPLHQYFGFLPDQEKALQAFAVTGLEKDFYFLAHVSGGGIHAQAHALQHGIAKALSTLTPELRRVLKKNGMLTRDDRKKERKKPGLRRARRAPQWAKR